METKPLMAITCLPTEEDYLAALAQERRAFPRPGLFEEPKLRRTAQIAAYLLLLGSALLFILSEGAFRNIGFLLFFLFALFSGAIEEPAGAKKKLRAEFSEAKSKSSSKNFFVWEDRLEIKGIYEEASYPWSLLTEWSAGESYLLRFGEENTRCIPARTLTKEEQRILELLLEDRTGKKK